MKLRLKMAGVLALGLLAYPVGGAGLGLGAEQADIQNALFQMRQAMAQYNTNKVDLEAAKQRLEGAVLGESELAGLQDRISMYRDQMAAYRAEMISDISYLRDHWQSLKPDEKDDVKRAEGVLG